MDNPKVSIIVPIYRVEEYIERCAESLFAQTFDDIEYIFVDDCSPDKSVEILQRTLEKYPQLQEVMDKMEGAITTEEMMDMNYKVDVEGKTPKETALEFLKEKGMIE